MKQEFRLIKKNRKGILAKLFSRITLCVVLLILQVLLLVSIYKWFGAYIKPFSIVMTIFTVAMVIYLFMSEMDATSKLTWMLLMALFPVPASILLLYVKHNMNSGNAQTKIVTQIINTKSLFKQDENVINELSGDDSGTVALSTYLKRSGCYNIYKNTDVEFFPLGEDKFKAMLEELGKAEKFIFMEYFIIDEGYMWGEILKVLIEKAKNGVDVRVMYDGTCELNLLPPNYPKLLADVGIKAKPFTPFEPIVSSAYNNRDHRKILVIDGKVAFNGGVNLADEYINHIVRFGHWKDTAIMLKGDAVKSFTLMFLQMWNSTEEEAVYEPFISAECESVKDASGYVLPYADCPLDEDKAGETVYMDILNRAQSYVHIMTPYLILDGELENALKYAAQRGVDVKIILPGIPDKKVAYALAKSHYKALLNAGVKIFEYTPGFVHAKIFVSDDVKATVGTINLDYRSLYHHFECATYLYKVKCISDIEEDFQNTLSKCTEVTSKSISDEKLYYKVVGPLIKFLAPLM